MAIVVLLGAASTTAQSLPAAKPSRGAPPPSAPPDLTAEKKGCVNAYEGAQRARKVGHLVESRGELVACGGDQCPAVVRSECIRWLEEVDRSLPSIVVSAKDASGRDTMLVRVTVDGRPFLERLDGKSSVIDPGPHALRFELPGATPVEQQVVVNQGEKNRPIVVSFEPDQAPATPVPVAREHTAPLPADASSGPSALPYVVGAIGVVGIGAFAAFALAGKAGEHELRDRGCAPLCDRGEVDAVRHKYLIADISLGVGVVALGAAAYLLLSGDHTPAASTTAARPALDLGPVAGGAGMTWSGRF